MSNNDTGEQRNLAADLRQSLDDATREIEQRELAALREELTKAQRAAQTLGNVVAGQARSLYAAWIEVARNDLHAASQWVLNSVPDVWDGPPEHEWNGTETGDEWFSRTDEPSAGAS